MKISIWVYEDNSCLEFNNNVSNFRIFKSDMFGKEIGLLIYPKNYQNILMDYRYSALLNQNIKIFERLGNYKAIKFLKENS